MFSELPWQSKRTHYEKLAVAEDGASEEVSEQQERAFLASRPRSQPWAFWIGTFVNLVILFISIGFFANARISTNAAAKKLFQDSMYLDSVELRIKDVPVNGTLFPPLNPSFSRAEPGDPEAEAVWERFEPSEFFPITREQLLRLGKDPEVSVKFPNDVYGWGDEAYVASFDTLHKVHCLNELRKSTFGNYPNMPQYFSGSGHDQAYKNTTHGKLWWIHLRHCVDLLAQDLICHADSDLMTYTWRDAQQFPYPDMSINRKCRDFDQLMEWNDEHKVDLKLYEQVQIYKPELHTKLLPQEKQFYEMGGFEDSTMFPNGEGFEEYFAANPE